MSWILFLLILLAGSSLFLVFIQDSIELYKLANNSTYRTVTVNAGAEFN